MYVLRRSNKPPSHAMFRSTFGPQFERTRTHTTLPVVLEKRMSPISCKTVSLSRKIQPRRKQNYLRCLVWRSFLMVWRPTRRRTISDGICANTSTSTCQIALSRSRPPTGIRSLRKKQQLQLADTLRRVKLSSICAEFKLLWQMKRRNSSNQVDATSASWYPVGIRLRPCSSDQPDLQITIVEPALD